MPNKKKVIKTLSHSNVCRECIKRNTCTRICDRAEQYISQDEVDRKSKTYRYPDGDNFMVNDRGTYDLRKDFYIPEDNYGEESQP